MKLKIIGISIALLLIVGTSILLRTTAIKNQKLEILKVGKAYSQLYNAQINAYEAEIKRSVKKESNGFGIIKLWDVARIPSGATSSLKELLPRKVYKKNEELAKYAIGRYNYMLDTYEPVKLDSKHKTIVNNYKSECIEKGTKIGKHTAEIINKKGISYKEWFDKQTGYLRY